MERNIRDSQNFLHDKKLVSSLVENSNINNTDIVYEIGPGKGIITEHLLRVSKSVIAIELDTSLYQFLKQNLNSQKLTLINQDFMNIKLPDGNYKVFSNIPFNMTGEILTRLLTAINPPQDMYIIMQYEAMLKYAGTPYYKDTLKSLMFKPLYDIKLAYEFLPSDFKPKPNVSIVLVHFHKKEYCDIKKATMLEYWDFLSYMYTAPGLNFKQKTKNIFSYEQQKRL
ncbi:TPA: ribosomal RNA small subunit methyltransferase A, partial [Salmonella enterica]